MIITRIKLTNLRAIEFAEFSFQPGFNLIVGINGVGKSTVLDSLRVCISRILPSITESRAKTMSFAADDMRSGLPFLDVELSWEVNGEKFRFTRLQWREIFASDDKENLEILRREILNSERLSDRARNLLRELENSDGVSDSDTFAPLEEELKKFANTVAIAPNCVYFSTNRSVLSKATTSKSKAVGGRSTAYAEALVPRPMYIGQFADWIRVQEALASEQRIAAHHLEVLRFAIARFLPKFENLRPDSENPFGLVIDFGGITLGVNQLSEGERGVLALVLDLARRLSQANPTLDDPLSEGEAVVLIDEIDLHLHPTWQRQIIHKLIDTFPRCQFIATTHSPQVIGEIEHDRIQIIDGGHVYRPLHSFGFDSSRVLDQIMGAESRTIEVKTLLSKLSTEIGEQFAENGRREFAGANELLRKLMNLVGEDDPEVIRVGTLLDLVENEE